MSQGLGRYWATGATAWLPVVGLGWVDHLVWKPWHQPREPWIASQYAVCTAQGLATMVVGWVDDSESQMVKAQDLTEQMKQMILKDDLKDEQSDKRMKERERERVIRGFFKRIILSIFF